MHINRCVPSLTKLQVHDYFYLYMLGLCDEINSISI